jgi:hypothetical protein
VGGDGVATTMSREAARERAGVEPSAPKRWGAVAPWKHHMLVRKVVPTLTSTSAEIYLLMAGAKQLSDTSFILVPSGAVRPTGVCSRHCIALHCGACRGELQVWRERRRCLQVPGV